MVDHETRKALESYLHKIDADIPNDWSDKIDFIIFLTIPSNYYDFS